MLSAQKIRHSLCTTYKVQRVGLQFQVEIEQPSLTNTPSFYQHVNGRGKLWRASIRILSEMAWLGEILSVLCVALRLAEGLTVSLSGSDTCQNFTVDEQYNSSYPRVLCCLV